MNGSTCLFACVCVLLSTTQVFSTEWNNVVFREDFDSSVDGMPDPDQWVINHPGEWWWIQGRTHFPNPDPWLPTGEFPRVENGTCVIEHHLYNPYDLATPNTTFLGGEIRTVMQFEPNRPYRFEARVRWRADLPYPYIPYPNGLVNSFFVYGYDGAASDEIDFEFLSNQVNDDVTYPDGDALFLTTWNESFQKPQCECDDCVAPPGLALTEWNTFRIYWYPDLALVEWTWLDPVNGETLLHQETDPFFIPDESMALYFNFWAPTELWSCAWDPALLPVDDPADNQICAYEIDYVEVRTSNETISAASNWGLASIGLLLMCIGTLILIRRQAREGLP